MAPLWKIVFYMPSSGQVLSNYRGRQKVWESGWGSHYVVEAVLNNDDLVQFVFLVFRFIYIYVFLFIYFKIYLFLIDIERERGRDTGGGRSRLHAGSPMWDSTPGLQDHALGQRQVLNHWATQGSLKKGFKSTWWSPCEQLEGTW